jgi:hypothetical protein
MSTEENVVSLHVKRFALMSLENTTEFWGQENGIDCWGPMDRRFIRTYTEEEVKSLKIGEDCIFVEILSLGTGNAGLLPLEGPNKDLLVADHERWAHRLNELFCDLCQDDFARLIGIHIDQNDFYFRMRKSNGADHFISMAIRLDPASAELSEEELIAVDIRLQSQGCTTQDEFLVTREVAKPWPRETAPVALAHAVSLDEGFIFGPFTDPDSLEAFQSKLAAAPGYTFQRSWTEDLSKHDEFYGVNIPERLWNLPSVDLDPDQYLQLMLMHG